MDKAPKPTRPVILIPARLASARLPNKPLADIHGKPMIVWVWERAMASKIGPVYVAADGPEIKNAIEHVGGQAVLTDPNLRTGSDRIYAALQQIDPEQKFDAVINVQGDEPLQDPENIKRAFALLQSSGADITSCATLTNDGEKIKAPQIVKIAMTYDANQKSGRALYFSRSVIPHGAGPYFHHSGLYAYRRAALEKFVNAPQNELEKRESLEQLRALGLGMHIEVACVENGGFGVDTPDDLEQARRIFATIENK